jgi:CheY-like chemotaxis protein
VRRDIAEVRVLADRGAALTRQILTVSRKQALQPTVLDLNALVADLERLFARLVGEDIRFRTARDRTAGAIRADASQLEQVLLNLVANARDAMPSGGVLSIETHHVALDEAATFGLEPKAWTMLLVRDTGVGMTAAVRERIFEPFFTTKVRGKGTGLGLALAYALLQQLQGVITCESAPGEGTTFRLFFPVAAGASEAVDSITATEPAPVTGCETILVEDEESVRVVAAAALERSGFRVLSASDGTDALRRSRTFDGPIDLLLTDVVMPGMHGRELAEIAMRERPELRVLFASGYTDDAVLLRGIRVDQVPFLQKPFTPAQLVTLVREVLDAPRVSLHEVGESPLVN